jgi:phage portal protein BeeE
LWFKYRFLNGEVPLLARRRFGVPAALVPMPPQWMVGTPTEADPTYQFRYGNWQPKPTPARDVFLYVNPSTGNPFGRGTSVTRALAAELELNAVSTEHLLRFFYGGALPTALITGEGLTPEEGERGMKSEQLKARWSRDLEGFGVFNPLFWPRHVEVNKLGSTFQELQIAEFRKQLRDAVFQCFGMPPELMGELGSANRSTIAMARLIFTVFTLIPLLEDFRDFVQWRLVPEYPNNDGGVWFWHDQIVHEDQEQQVRRMRIGPQLQKVDEWRHFYGQEPLGAEQGGEKFVMRQGFQLAEDLDALLPPQEEKSR